MFLVKFLSYDQKQKLNLMVSKLQSFAMFNGAKFNINDLNLQQLTELQVYAKGCLMENYGTYDMKVIQMIKKQMEMNNM